MHQLYVLLSVSYYNASLQHNKHLSVVCITLTLTWHSHSQKNNTNMERCQRPKPHCQC